MNPLIAIFAATQVIIVNPPKLVTSTERDEDAAAWVIIGDGAELTNPGESLKKGDPILRQRLVPKRLAVLSDDVERSDGKDRWAKAGDQMFGAKIGDYDAYCVLKSKLNLTAGLMLMPIRSRILKQDCFIDSDGDGKLDQRFEADPGIGVLPNVARSEPRAFYDLAPVAFTEIDPASFADESWVELEFRGGGGKKGKPPELRINYRYDGKTRKISERYIGGDVFPSQAYLLGAEITFEERERGKLSATVERPMDASFGVTTQMVSF